MSHNSFGHLFRVTTWGESHGPALGCTVDGTPPRVPIPKKTFSTGSTGASLARTASPHSAAKPMR